MTDLYTATLNRKRITTLFAPNGDKIGETVELIPVTLHDLPATTAQGYKTNFPAADVKIERQAPPTRREASTYKHSGKSAPRPAAAEPEIDETAAAATSGDMAAVVNAEMEG